MTAEPTALYRLFDAEECLLYVGISGNPPQRWNDHSAEKSWWGSVARKAVEWHESRKAAAQAEAVAVRLESPIYNLTLPAEDGSTSYTLRFPENHWRRRQVRPPSALRSFAVDRQLWAKFGDAVRRSPDAEADMSKVLRQFVRWYAGEPGAKLPERPDQPVPPVVTT